MIRYHVVEEAGSILLLKQSVSYHSAQIFQQRLKTRYPERNYKIVAVDVWNQFLRSLDRF